MKTFRRRLVIGLLLSGISFLYLFLSIARGPLPLHNGYTTELYALLAESFLQGETTLPVEPRLELLSLPNPYDPAANWNYRLNDASLYAGQYYLYFGPVPAVTLFAPYRLVTGRDLPNRAAVPVFCIAGLLCSCGLFFLLAEHNRWALPLWLECAIVVSLGSMSLVCLLIREPVFYEVAIAGGYCFVMAGFLTLARAILTPRSSAKWLLAAGVLFGMAVGCRPHFAVICAIVLVAFAIRARRSLRLVIALAAGMALCGIALGWYNYVRFDDPLEFGRTYQLTRFLDNNYSGVKFNPAAIFPSAVKFLFQPPRLDKKMPFFHLVLLNPLQGRPGTPVWTEGMVGLFPMAPVALLGCFMPLVFRRGQGRLLDEDSMWLLYTMYWSGVLIFLVLCALGLVFGRYIVDFAPLLTFAGACAAGVLWQELPERRIKYTFSWGLGAATIYGAIANLALATPGLDGVLKYLGK